MDYLKVYKNNKKDKQYNILRLEQRDTVITDRYLKKAGLPVQFVNYDNCRTYIRAKKTAYCHLISEHDQKVLQKFCKQWIIHNGVLPEKTLRRIQSMVKYYAQKQQNYNCKQRRLQTRAV